MRYREAQVDKLLSLAHRYNHMRDTHIRIRDMLIYTKKYKKRIEGYMKDARKDFEDYLHNPKADI
jgi:hypothetical protein